MEYLTRGASSNPLPQKEIEKTQGQEQNVHPKALKAGIVSLPKINRVYHKPPAMPSPKTSGEHDHIFTPINVKQTPTTQSGIKRESVRNIIDLFENRENLIEKRRSQREFITPKRPLEPDPPSLEEQKERLPLELGFQAEQAPLTTRKFKVPPIKTLRQTKSSSALQSDLPESLSRTIDRVLEFGEALIKAEAIKNNKDPEQVLEIFRDRIREKNFNNTVRVEVVWKEIESMVSKLLQENNNVRPKTPRENKILDKVFSKLMPSFKDLQQENNHKKFKRLGIDPHQEDIIVLHELKQNLQNLVNELEAVREGKDIKKHFKSPAAKKIYEIISGIKETKGIGTANTAHMIAQEIRAYITLEDGLEHTLETKVKAMGIYRTNLKEQMLTQLSKHNENFSLELGRLIGGNYVDILSNEGNARSYIDELFYGNPPNSYLYQDSAIDYRVTTSVERQHEEVTSMLLTTAAFSPTTIRDRTAKEYRAHMKDLLIRTGQQYEITESLLSNLLDKILSDIPKDTPENAISDFRSLQKYLSEMPGRLDRLKQLINSDQTADLSLAIDGILQLAQEMRIPESQYEFLKRYVQNPMKAEISANDLLENLMGQISTSVEQLNQLLPTIDAFFTNFSKNRKLEFELAKEYREKIYAMMELFAQRLGIDWKSLQDELKAFIPRQFKEPWLDDPEYVFSEFGQFYNHLCHEYERGNDPKMHHLITLLRTANQKFLLSLGTTLFHASKSLLGKEYKTRDDAEWKDQQWKKNNFIFGDASTNVVIERVGRLNVNPQLLVSQVIELEFKKEYQAQDLKMLIVLRQDPTIKVDPKTIPNFESPEQVIENFRLLTSLMNIGLKVI